MKQGGLLGSSSCAGLWLYGDEQCQVPIRHKEPGSTLSCVTGRCRSWRRDRAHPGQAAFPGSSSCWAAAGDELGSSGSAQPNRRDASWSGGLIKTGLAMHRHSQHCYVQMPSSLYHHLPPRHAGTIRLVLICRPRQRPRSRLQSRGAEASKHVTSRRG